MSNNKDVYVVIEHLRGEVLDISYVMLAAARALTDGTGGEVVGVLLGHDAQALAGDMAADRVLYFDHEALAEFTPEAYLSVLAGVFEGDAPRAVLMGDTSIGADVAGRLAIRLGLPVVSHCQKLEADGGTPKFVSQICGGKIMAEGTLPEPAALVTMVPGGYKSEQGQGAESPPVTSKDAPPLEGLRVSLAGYVEPDTTDVDISQEPILVSVGRGVGSEDDMEMAQELADALGGVVCASRPVVDQGWLPTTRLVGKSGKLVKPKVYLALGISGAPEHTESIIDSEMIIAINTDPAAPIFDIARYGAEIDLLDLLPELTDRVLEAKGE
jgi:electron transfer flavoprotein alpha subunit